MINWEDFGRMLSERFRTERDAQLNAKTMAEILQLRDAERFDGELRALLERDG